MSQNSPMPSGSATDAASGRSHIIAGARLTGDLEVPGLIELLGHVKGTVTADSILIETQGNVDGELRAATVSIRGTFTGKIVGKAVKLQSSAQVSGDISYETLSVESGATVDASFRPATRG